MSAIAPPAPTRRHRPTAPDPASVVGSEVTTMAWVAEDRGLQAEWLDLAARLEPSSYARTPDWVLAWWRHQGRPETTVTTWRDDAGHLAALVALSRIRAPVVRRLGWTVEAVATTGADAGRAGTGAWLVAPEAVGAVRRWAERMPGDRPLLVIGVEAGAAQAALPSDARSIDRSVRLRVVLPADVGALPLPVDLRNALERGGRRFADDGVECTWVGADGLTPARLLTLRHLQLLRRAHGGPDGAAGGVMDDDRVRLHGSLVRAGHRDRGPAAVVARRGDATIGMIYGVRWRDAFAVHGAGWDPARVGTGGVLVHIGLRLAAANGVRVVEVMDDDPVIRAFGVHEVLDETWCAPRRPAGRVLQATSALRRSRSH